MSLWTLFGWLQKAGMEPAAKIKCGKPCISRLILTDQSEAADAEKKTEDSAAVYVYFSQSNDMPTVTMLRSGDDLISIPNMPCALVCNELVRAFDFYNEWEQKLLMALLKGDSLQELLDIAHIAFDRPMFIKSSSSWAFAVTSGYDGAVHPDWIRLQESMTTRRSSMEAVRAVSMDPKFNKTFQDKYPAILESPYYGGPVLHANVWLEEQRVCEIIAIENGKSFNLGDPHLMNQFASIVERYMTANQNLYLSFSGISALLVELIKSHEYDDDNLKLACDAAGWEEGDHLAVISVGSRSSTEAPVDNVLREQLISGLKYSCVFTYQGKTVCVVDITKNEGRKNLIERLIELVPKEIFYWGMSYEFTDLRELPIYYLQSLDVMEKSAAAGSPWNTMYQVALDVIHDRLEESMEYHSLIHPDVRKLMDIDDRNGSQYLKTMFEYLICGGNYTDAANHLGLHRNSMIYRVARIKEIISTDLDDSTNRILLLFSFLMVQKK